MLNHDRQVQLINLCRDLVKIRSYSGDERSLAERLKFAFKELGYDDVYFDEYGNITGHIKGSKEGKAVLFDGHMDTVPVSDVSKWRHDPFGAEIEGGKIYGRGTSDMKGALSAMICAVAYFAMDSEKDFAGNIYMAGVVHEECFEGVGSRKISERVNPDYVIIGEASELNIKRGQRGRAEIIVETIGKPAHSANPEKGINAVYKMSKLINRIHELQAKEHQVLGKGILELTDIKSFPYPGASVVPEYCRATYDRRLLVGEIREEVLKPIQEIIDELEKEDSQFKARVYFSKGEEKCYTGSNITGERFFPGWIFDENEEFIKDVYAGLQNIGFKSEITHYSFCTNGSHYAGERGIKTIGFGPSKENLAHTVDEFIEIEQLIKGCMGYYSIIETLLK